MTIPDQPDMFPSNLRKLFMLSGTLLAALLYALVLGGAIVITLISPDEPTFDPNYLRAASLLSGLVGSIVTAGFARSTPSQPVHISAEHAMGGHSLTAWNSIKPPSLLQRNLLGLADTLGISTRPDISAPSDLPLERVQEPNAIVNATWVAVVYLLVYVFVGVAAFVVSIFHSPTPELIAQAGWVWLGTIVSSAYSFFGLNTQA